jgi:PAS domain S-box-containing protein
MFWSNIWLMTAVDVLVMGIVGFGLGNLAGLARQLPKGHNVVGLYLVAAGASIIALLYLGDLVAMHVLPRFIPMREAMGVMEQLHLEISWFLVPLGLAAAAAGAFVWHRGTLSLAGDLRSTADERDQETAARRLFESRLVDSEARFRAIFEDAAIGISLVGPDKCFVAVNRAYEEMTGYAAEELIGKPFSDITHPNDRLEQVSRTEQLERGEIDKFAIEKRYIRKDGETLWTNVTVSLIRGEDGEAKYTVGMIEDIGERKRMADALLHAKDDAERANAAKSEFLANMSHELRTPLNAIIGFADLIRMAPLGPLGHSKYEEYANDIRDSGEHLSELIGHILDLAKIEAGKITLDEDDVDVADTIRICLAMLTQRACAGGVELLSELPSEPLPWLRVDLLRLRQILANLLSNAVKFTPQDGKVCVRAWVSAERGFIIEVADTGYGIEPSDIPKALSRFEQVDGRLNRKFEGTGLGLPLTQTLVELHGGTMDLQSVVGKGTTVIVRFPAERIVREGSGAAVA